MVLRSGIIIPFQFRDNKKLLMIGVPEENRNLNIWDLRNVVRAAFGIYNFEFRNKKIGFNIPDELLLHYLAQRHDLTNFVIEIGQDPCEATSDNVLVNPSSGDNFVTSDNNLQITENTHISEVNRQEFRNPFDGENAFANASETLDKGCIYQDYTEQNERSKSKSEQNEGKAEQNQKAKEHSNASHIQDPQQPETPVFSQRQPFEFRGDRYNSNNRSDTDIHLKKVDYQQNPFTACAMNRFRRRGERMSKDQKEMYVKYFEENPCMLSQRRNDSVLESHWNKLAAILNSVPQGAVKNVEEWKQTFDAWRYRVFMYYRYNYKLAGSVTHNVKNFKPLTATDQRAYTMWTSYKNTPPEQSDKPETYCKTETINASYNY
ncbi:uncharacterized protein [Eurosta solidaginis]|uniref:uncharacterized protein isoform X3 n=1 Tax=Eurosta solidaginis TaxID=178769 RepID=UPI003530C22B